MFALISLLVVLIGCANWLTIGLLQFDFVAGLFGSQSNIFSRIVYVIVGVCAVILTVNIIKNKGRIGFNFKKLKMKKQPELAPAETSKEFAKDSPKEQNYEVKNEHYQQNQTDYQNQQNNYTNQQNSQKFHQPNSNGYSGESSRDNSKNELKSLSQQLNDRHNFNKNLRNK